MLLTNGWELESYEDGMLDDHKDEWMKDIQEEIQSMHDKFTYKLVDLPKCKITQKNRRTSWRLWIIDHNLGIRQD